MNKLLVNSNFLNTANLSLLLMYILFCVAGCVAKTHTTPRSEIIAQAKEKGITLPTPEEERAMFFKYEDENRARLLTLLKDRAPLSVNVDGAYIIGSQDDIQISVFDVPELNTSVKVLQDGNVNLPLIGSVRAKGKSEFDLLNDLTKKLSVFVKNPQVSLTISKYGSQKVALLGAVRKPGSYPLKKGYNSVLEMLSQGGGVSDKAGNYINLVPAELNQVETKTVEDVEARARLALESSERPVSGEKGIELYLDQVLGTNGGIPVNIPVVGGDMIIIPEAGKVMLEGEIQKPGPYDLTQQMTLLGSLASAGGITYGAKIDEVEVVRDFGKEQKARLIINLEELARGEGKDVRLRNGDIVRVPSDSGRRLTEDTFESISRVFNVGIGGSVPLR